MISFRNRTYTFVASVTFLCSVCLWAEELSLEVDHTSCALATAETSQLSLIEFEPLSDNSQMSFQERIAAIAAVDHTLGVQNRADCLHYVTSHQGLGSLRATQNHQLKNDVLRALRNQQDPNEMLTRALLEIYYDQQQDSVMQEYAVQHLSVVYHSSNLRSEIDKVLLNALEYAEDTRAGTALLALMRLQKASLLTPEMVEEFKNTCVALCGNANVLVPVRISAIQVAGELQIVESLSVLSQVIESDTTAFSIRLAVIGALGKIKTAKAKPLLEHELNTSNSILERATVKALENYES